MKNKVRTQPLRMNYTGVNPPMSMSGIILSAMSEPEPEPEVQEDLNKMESATPYYGDGECDHDFLVPTMDEHGNKFWCKVCDKKFMKHPTRIQAELSLAAVAAADPSRKKLALASFRDGLIGLKDAMAQTKLSVEELHEAMKAAFPVKRELERVTCYEYIDKILSDPATHLDTISDLPHNHNDIESVDFVSDIGGDCIIVDFRDGSKQVARVSKLSGVWNSRNSFMTYKGKHVSDNEIVEKYINDPHFKIAFKKSLLDFSERDLRNGNCS